MSKSLDPDQDRPSVGPDLGPKFLQRLSTDDKKSPLARKVLSENSCLLMSSAVVSFFIIGCILILHASSMDPDQTLSYIIS